MTDLCRASLRRRLTAGVLTSAVTALTGCAGGVDSGASSRSLIMDQLHNGGTAGFLFLPPMVPKPAMTGDIVPMLPITVQIDEIDANSKPVRTVATFTSDSGPKGERVRYHLAGAAADMDDDDGDQDPIGYYLARWKTDDENLSLSATYRARVLVTAKGGGTRELGFADVDVVRNQKQFRSVDRQEFTPLINGQTLRIKFRVDRPAVDRDVDGVLDWSDNCPTIANPDQKDSLGNGIGDACRCDTLPADFGGIHCTGSFASCGAKGEQLLHVFTGQAPERDGEISVACTSDLPVLDPSLGTTLHGSPLLVGCDGGITFTIDPALGPGVHTAEFKAGEKKYALRFEHAFGSEATPCAGAPKATCHRVRSEVHLALEDLGVQGLDNCRLVYTVTATAGAAGLENGRLVGRGASLPEVLFAAVPLTGASAELTCSLHPLDGKLLDGAASNVKTQCGETADSAGPLVRLPTLCQHQSDGAKTVERNTFADLHASDEEAQPDPIGARLGRIGQQEGVFCPAAIPALNKVEVFEAPRPAGALGLTARIRRLTDALQMADYYRANVTVSVAVKGDGLPVLELAKGLSVAALEKGVPMSVPAEYAKASNPTTVIRGALALIGPPTSTGYVECDMKANPIYCWIVDGDFAGVDRVTFVPGGGGPIEKLDLALDVEVK